LGKLPRLLCISEDLKPVGSRLSLPFQSLSGLCKRPLAQETEIKFKIGETNQQLTALLHREPKKGTESPAKPIASLCGLLFFFPWWSLRG
jgi:hypothetical protein